MKRIGKIIRPAKMTLDEMKSEFYVLPEEYQSKYRGGCGYCNEWLSAGKKVYTQWSWEQLMDQNQWPGGWVCGIGYVSEQMVYTAEKGAYCSFHQSIFVGYNEVCEGCVYDFESGDNTIVYEKMNYGYALVEDIGAKFMYKVRVTVDPDPDQLYISVVCIEPDSVDMFFRGYAELLLDGKVISNQSFKLPDSYYSQTGTDPLGNTIFNLKDIHGDIQVRVTVGATGQSESGFYTGSAPFSEIVYSTRR